MILALLLVAAAADPQQTPRRMDVSVWAVAGYDRASGSGGATPAVESGFGFDLGGHALYRVAAPFAVGALADWALAGPSALLVAPAVGLSFEGVTISGGFGYATLKEGGFGALAAIDYRVFHWVALRVQGTWEHSSYTVLQNPGVLVDVSATVWALLGGLALHF